MPYTHYDPEYIKGMVALNNLAVVLDESRSLTGDMLERVAKRLDALASELCAEFNRTAKSDASR